MRAILSLSFILISLMALELGVVYLSIKLKERRRKQ